MNCNYEFFFRLQDYKVSSFNDKSFNEICERFAQRVSDASDLMLLPRITLGDWSYVQNSYDAMALCVALILSKKENYRYEMYEDIFNRLMKKAEHYAFQGKWLIVKKFLQSNFFTSGWRNVQIILSNMSENAFFGNFLPRVIYFLDGKLVLTESFIPPKDFSNRRDRLKGIRRIEHKRGASDKTPRRSLTQNPNRFIRVGSDQILLIESESNSVNEPPRPYWFNNKKPKGRCDTLIDFDLKERSDQYWQKRISQNESGFTKKRSIVLKLR